MPPETALKATLEPVHDVAELGREWRELESVANASFFQCWDWVGSLLENAEGVTAPRVLRVTAGSGLKGLALMWSGREWRHGFVHSRSLHLNESGRREIDRVTLEHNSILAAAGAEAAVVGAAIQHLASRRDWDECLFSGMDQGVAERVHDQALRCSLWYRTRWTKVYHMVDLDTVRRAGGDYLDTLSANTRYQARRALKVQSAAGPLQCKRADSLLEALAWFEDLVRLHQAHWIARGEPGAFSTDFVRRFHRSVIQLGWPRGAVQLLRVTAGSELVGYVYNFEHQGVASNYQSGHVAATSNKSKPGLVVHCLAVQDSAQRGLATYDMLMGGDHFKPSLTHSNGTMTWAAIQQRRPTLALENLLRELRASWHRRSQSSRRSAHERVESEVN